MKNLLAILKIFVLASVMIIPANVSAYSLSVTALDKYIGNWYDVNGNLIFKIGSDYSINGCKVLSIYSNYSKGGEYKIQIAENGGTRYIDIDDLGIFVNGSDADVKDYHGYLIYNNNTLLRNTKNPRYFESIGGIYLGMNQNEVLRLYGEPSKKTTNYDNSTWEYKNLGLKISFYLNVVRDITIYSYGDRKFDWSGLSANSSGSAFANKYRTEISRRGNLNIGHGEIISLRNNSVVLQIFTPGFVF